MQTYLYFSLTPEALIASMLPPEEFGNYFAVGTKKRTRGQAMFFEVDSTKLGNHFPIDEIEKRCVLHQDGTPKRSLYLSIYRVLEHIPLEALKDLYLVTDDGRVLALKQGEFQKEAEKQLHLYQELSPVNPRIASGYSPDEFMQHVTDTSQPVSVPKLVFVELQLNSLSEDPKNGKVNDLPYPNIDHLRDCLIGLQEKPSKATKTVIRTFQGELFFRTCKNGFFIGDKDNLLFYPFPSLEELKNKYYVWWRSALNVGLR
jgi:hypothetical protein